MNWLRDEHKFIKIAIREAYLGKKAADNLFSTTRSFKAITMNVRGDLRKFQFRSLGDEAVPSNSQRLRKKFIISGRLHRSHCLARVFVFPANRLRTLTELHFFGLCSRRSK